MRFISSMPWVICGQEKGVPAEGIYFPGENKSFQAKNKITDFICLINHGIYPPNIKYNVFMQEMRFQSILNVMINSI